MLLKDSSHLTLGGTLEHRKNNLMVWIFRQLGVLGKQVKEKEVACWKDVASVLGLGSVFLQQYFFIVPSQYKADGCTKAQNRERGQGFEEEADSRNEMRKNQKKKET